jgi:hypothetical protein
VREDRHFPDLLVTRLDSLVVASIASLIGQQFWMGGEILLGQWHDFLMGAVQDSRLNHRLVCSFDPAYRNFAGAA